MTQSEPSTSGLRIPKQRARILVTSEEGAETSVTIFLAEATKNHPGPERLQEWLLGPALFLPVEDESGRVAWLNRESLLFVRAPATLDHDESAESTIPTEEEISVHLRNGQIVTGLVAYVLPNRQSRLTDFLNRPHPFLRLVDGSDVLFINKHHVVRVTIFEASDGSN